MEQSKPSTSTSFLSHHPITDREREACEILLNLPYFIKKSESLSKIPAWGAKGRRSAIDLTPSLPPCRHRRPPEKKIKTAAGDSSPASPLSFSPSESLKKIPKKKTREELLETINELAQARESLLKELEKVKGLHNKLRVYNMELKAKQQEYQQREPNFEPEKGVNTKLELSQITNPFPQLPENPQPCNYQFLNLLQQQQNLIFHCPFNHTHPYSSPPGLPDLNVSADEVFEPEYLQPLDQNVQAIEYGNKARAAEARKRRMVRVKEMKLKC